MRAIFINIRLFFNTEIRFSAKIQRLNFQKAKVCQIIKTKVPDNQMQKQEFVESQFSTNSQRIKLILCQNPNQKYAESQFSAKLQIAES